MGKRLGEFKYKVHCFCERHKCAITAGSAAAGTILGNLLWHKLFRQRRGIVTRPESFDTRDFENGIVHPWATTNGEDVSAEEWCMIRENNYRRVCKFAETLDLCDGEYFNINGPGCVKGQADNEYIIDHMVNGD